MRRTAIVVPQLTLFAGNLLQIIHEALTLVGRGLGFRLQVNEAAKGFSDFTHQHDESCS